MEPEQEKNIETGKLIGTCTIRIYENVFNIEHDGNIDSLRLIGTLEVIKGKEVNRFLEIIKKDSQP